MTIVPYALSVHSLVNSLGADAGLAAIVGLAILILLYFAQARETSSLRERLDDAAQWIEELEGRLGQLQRGQGAPARPPAQAPPGGTAVPGPAGAGGVARPPGQPVPRSAGAAGAAASAAGAAAGAAGVAGASSAGSGQRIQLTGAPAGMAAPALAAATRLIPVAGPAAAPAESQNGEEETRIEAPGAATAAGATQTAGSGASPVTTPAPASQDRPGNEDTMLAAPAPATAAALANGRSQSSATASPPAAPPARAPIRAANGQGGAGGRSAALNARPAASRDLPPLRTMSVTGPSRARRLLPILIGLGLVVVIVVALLIVTQNNSSSTTVHKPAKVSAHSRNGTTAAINPASVTVGVLNGTTVTNLAHDVSSRLATDGYKQGTIATAAAQTESTTTVAYLPGHQADARAVAAVLNLKTSAVKPIDQQAMGVACPGASSGGTSSCSADVVVTVGSDLAGLASPQSG